MRKLTLVVFAVALSMTLIIAKETIMAQEKPAYNVVRHVVLFKFKDTATPEQIKKVEQDFRALRDKIKQIVEFEWGTNVSPENLSQGFTHCFLLTFRSEADRDAYIVHPAHKEFASTLGPVLDKVLVVDYKPPIIMTTINANVSSGQPKS